MSRFLMTHIYALESHRGRVGEALGDGTIRTPVSDALEDFGEYHKAFPRITSVELERAKGLQVTALIQTDGRADEPGVTRVFIDGEMAEWGTDASGAAVVQPMLRGDELVLDLGTKERGDLLRFMRMQREFWDRLQQASKPAAGAA